MRVRATVIAAAMLGVALVAPTTAQAALSQCTGTKMCVWGNNNFVWLLAAQAHGQGVIDPFNNSQGEDGEADSWANRSGTYNGCLYDGHGTSPLKTMSRTSNDNNMLFLDSNRASSMRTNEGC